MTSACNQSLPCDVTDRSEEDNDRLSFINRESLARKMALSSTHLPQAPSGGERTDDVSEQVDDCVAAASECIPVFRALWGVLTPSPKQQCHSNLLSYLCITTSVRFGPECCATAHLYVTCEPQICNWNKDTCNWYQGFMNSLLCTVLVLCLLNIL